MKSSVMCVCLSVLALLVAISTAQKTSMSMEKQPSHDRVVVCYISSWAVYRPGRGAFHAENIDPSLCTHLIYAFTGLNSTTNEIRSLDPPNDLTENYGKGMFKKVTSLKTAFPHLKVTVAIGGWNEGSSNYSQMVLSPEKRQQFISSVVNFIRKHNFDGLDLDWEYPANRGGVSEDKQNYVTLVKELRQEFDKYGWLVTAALGAGKAVIDSAYDIPALSQYLDFMHLMCYDYHGTWEKMTGANAPLRGSSVNDMLSVEHSLRYYLRLGAPAKKLVLGLPLYGRTFITLNDEAQRFGEPALEKGFQGQFTKEDGYMSFHEICLELGAKNSTWKKHWDDKTETPFLTDGNRLISYDDARSLTLKVQLAMEGDLAGIMIWPLDNDDFHGECTEGNDSGFPNYPLLRTINKAIADAIRDKQNEIPSHDHDKHGSKGSGAGLSASAGVAAVSVLLASLSK